MAHLEIPITFDIPDEQLEQAIEKAIKSNPDYVAVTRCKDCKYLEDTEWCAIHGHKIRENDYCSYGEKGGEKE